MDPTTERLAAAIAGHYRLERELGAGGMATVYLAEDLKHHRRVAIKVLRPDIAAAVGPGRFEDEIEIAAQLTHPHIVPVHDSGAADGFLYYVMPLIDGETLRERLQKGERIPVPDVVRLLAEIADALAFAHEHGVVHRDIKPENIMLAGRHALVMDFGIAKAVRDAGARRSSTSMGLAIGTPEYMSPEQAGGDPNLDHRTDVYSLGVLGYELLTGKPPFSGGGTEQILTRHITQRPAPIVEQRPDVPPILAAVIMRALAKSPGERWQTAEEMRAQLEPLMTTTSGSVAATRLFGVARRPKRVLAWAAVAAVVVLGGLAASIYWGGKHQTAVAPSTASPATKPAAVAATGIPDLATDPSIAVLPFENMSSDKEQAYFSDGISEELLNLLAKVPGLRVVARTSSFQFKGQELGIQEIARKLHVAAVLEGSVRKSGDTVRITAQLVRASDGSHLWSETYDRKLDDVFKVQDEIAAEVVDKLKLTLMSGAPKARPVDPRVYPLILQGQAVLNQATKASRQESVEIYRRAIGIAPDEPRAWSELGRAYLNQAMYSELTPAEGVRLAKGALLKAQALDPDDGSTTGRLAFIASNIENDQPAAAALYQRALAQDPTNPSVLGNASTWLASIGRLDEAIQLCAKALEKDPTNAPGYARMAVFLMTARRWDESIAANRMAQVLSPGHGSLRASIGTVLLIGKRDAAGALAEIRAEPDELSRVSTLPLPLYALGRTQEADAAMADLVAKHSKDAAYSIAAIHAYRGQTDQAFAWLDRCVANEEPGAVSMLTDPLFDSLHKDPRWVPMLRHFGVAPEQLSKIHFELPPGVGKAAP